ncbi:hypothetical protein [Lentzea flava]|uniref:Excalibur calcium-binding domain-containing protein n=1 Tax=Lentzea flava TaxID=103732 RepID=A0ABQ2UF66_9PSEU|nr:hypothetical protein [Lentzea flava]MCP2198674.1 hypothetical protein [Lentzea flava]GGU29282.1 hypothetical protein GCM10010178_21830 [Lentzea flava]
MTGVRRRGYLAAAVAVMGAALVAALFAAPPDKPVDIRLVAPPPPAPETVTATATTNVSAVGPVETTTPAPPPPPVAAKPLPRQKPAPTTPAPTTTTRPRDLLDFLRCDYKSFDDDDIGRCLPWPLTPKELCQYVEDHDLIDVRDHNGRELDDLDLDCD